MEHAEARELLELAAIEPDGFERLAAGDTPESAALAGHLAGCPECSTELERLRRSALVIRDAVRTVAPPDLKDRTLAFVAAVGRDRSAVGTAAVAVPVVAGAAPAVAPATASASAPAAAPATAPIAIERAQRRRSAGTGRLAMWAATIAAGIVIAIVATQLLVVGPQNEQFAQQQERMAGLARAAAAALSIQGEANAKRVELTSTTGDEDVTGTIAYGPRSNRLVVLAQGLEQPPAGMVYRCWVESGGERTTIGQMFFAGDVAFWVGEVPEITVNGEISYGVSLSPVGDPSDVSADPVLVSDIG
jgi:hypothetical protein